MGCKFCFVVRILSLAAALLLFYLALFPLHQEARADWVSNIGDRIVSIFRDEQPPAQPKGIERGGAGRNPICSIGEGKKEGQLIESILALMLVIPEDFDNSDSDFSQEFSSVTDVVSENRFVGGYTVEQNPTFWFYLPYRLSKEDFQGSASVSPNRVAQFTLLDESNNLVLNEFIKVELLQTPHLIEYSLPYSLEIGKVYNWYFSVVCDSEKLSRNPVVRGWVQRVDATPELQTALSSVSGPKRYKVYAENGIWFEAMTALANARRQFPTANQEDWDGLLKYFGITDASQFDLLEATEPVEREVVKGNQFPAIM